MAHPPIPPNRAVTMLAMPWATHSLLLLPRVILTWLLLSDASSGESISALRPFYPISYAAMTGVLDTLEKDGLIERSANPEDRRRVNIRLSEKRRKFIIDFLPVHVENVKKISSELQEDDAAQMF